MNHPDSLLANIPSLIPQEVVDSPLKIEFIEEIRRGPGRPRGGTNAPRKHRITARDQNFYWRYLRGETLAEIGAAHGITRERVRQRLKRMGISRKDGGASVAARLNERRAEKRRAINAERRRRRREAHCLKWFGVSIAEYCELTGAKQYDHSRYYPGVPTLHRRFICLKSACVRRGIAWTLSLRDYWNFWLASGKWPQVGRGKNDYCLGRKGAGGFTLDNIRVCTNSENIRNSYISIAPAAMRAAKALATKRAKAAA